MFLYEQPKDPNRVQKTILKKQCVLQRHALFVLQRPKSNHSVRFFRTARHFHIAVAKTLYF